MDGLVVGVWWVFGGCLVVFFCSWLADVVCDVALLSFASLHIHLHHHHCICDAVVSRVVWHMLMDWCSVGWVRYRSTRL